MAEQGRIVWEGSEAMYKVLRVVVSEGVSSTNLRPVGTRSRIEVAAVGCHSKVPDVAGIQGQVFEHVFAGEPKFVRVELGGVSMCRVLVHFRVRATGQVLEGVRRRQWVFA